MPYLGNEPFTQYSETKTQVLTGDGTVGPYTLDYEVGSVGDVEVFVNNVRQQGGSSYAYTVSGNQLTMTGAVAASDDFYVVFQGKATPSGQIPEKESNGDYNFDNGTLFIDASTNRVGIGENSPDRSLHITGTEPSVVLENSGQGTDLKTWRIYSNSSSLQVGTVDDAFASGQNALEITRNNTDNITGIQFKTGASSEIGRFTTDGLTFNGDTAAANALDDYEEGTWTPANTASVTLTSGTWYSKVGKHVTLNAFINIATNSSSSGCHFQGFPYALSGGVSSSVGVFSNANEDLYAYFDGTHIRIRNNSNNTKTFGSLSGKFVAFQFTYTA